MRKYLYLIIDNYVFISWTNYSEVHHNEALQIYNIQCSSLLPAAHTDFYMFGFFPTTIKKWDSLSYVAVLAYESTLL